MICQALNTTAFVFCRAYDGSMGSDLLWHHCLLPPHGVEDCTVFLHLSCAFDCIRDLLHSRPSPRSFPVFLAWHCALLAPVFQQPGTLPRWRRSVFAKFSASICQTPWLSLKTLTTCVFGMRLCALEYDRFLMHTKTIPTAPGKLAGTNTLQRNCTSEPRTFSMNFLLNVTCLSDGMCTHLTL